MTSKLKILLITFLASYSPQISAKLYKCVNNDGKVSYSQLPCEEQTSQILIKESDANLSSHSLNGKYRSIDDVINTYSCNTTKKGAAVFPSRSDLLDVMKNSELNSLNVKTKYEQIYDQLGLKWKDVVPAGRACSYRFHEGFVFFSFSGNEARNKNELLSIEEMISTAEKLGYPIKTEDSKRSYHSFDWQENGYNCNLKIADRSNSISTMTTSCRKN